jgi:hypothetical protein
MSIDDLMFLIIIGGMVLSIVYLKAQYAVRRSYRIAERANALRLRELYGTRPKPVASAVAPHLSPNAVLHRSLPVQVRLVYRARAAIEGSKATSTSWP